jgi:small-conductance mechanosensitive channel
MLVKSVITNYSRFPVRRFDMPLRVGLDTEFAHLERVVAAVVEANPLVLEEPHYRLFVKGLGESHLNLQLSVWAVQDRFVDMRDKIQIEVLHALQGEGIEVPLPHRVIEQRKA